MRFFLYMLLNFKRCLKRPAVLALLLLFPVFSLTYRHLGSDREQGLCVYVYAENEDSFCTGLAGNSQNARALLPLFGQIPKKRFTMPS